MTNKPTYMKRIIIGSSLLFSVLLAAPQAYAQESVDVIIRENGTERREVIDLPKSMTYPVDSLLNDWKATALWTSAAIRLKRPGPPHVI